MSNLRALAPFASPATTTDGSVVVRDETGARLAEARRRGNGDRARWRWSAVDPELGTFVVEPSRTTGHVWLVTRTDGAPFGQLEIRGSLLRRRLELTDGRGLHLAVSPLGAVRAPDGQIVARFSRDSGGRVQLALCADLDATWRTLLLAAALVRPGN